MGVGEAAETVTAENSQDKHHQGTDLSIIISPCTYERLDTHSKRLVINQLVPGRPRLVLGDSGDPLLSASWWARRALRVISVPRSAEPGPRSHLSPPAIPQVLLASQAVHPSRRQDPRKLESWQPLK